MKLPTPPWKFTNVQRQEKEFKDWINQRLDELAEPTEEDLLREVIMQDYADQEEAYFTKMYRRCKCHPLCGKARRRSSRAID